jgi:hypothetical protein
LAAAAIDILRCGASISQRSVMADFSPVKLCRACSPIVMSDNRKARELRHFLAAT